MLKIAICDDRQEDRDATTKALDIVQDKWEQVFDTTYFHCGEDLCEDVKLNTYDVILLDICMTGIDGIKTAEIIRSLGIDIEIIFVSSVAKSFTHIEGFAFLDKPINMDLFETALQQIYNNLK